MTGIKYQISYDSFDDIALLQDILPFFDRFDEIPFKLTKEDNLINAYWLSELCRLAYITSQRKIEKECAKVNLIAKSFWWKNTEFLVAHDADKIFIVGRGTETKEIVDIFTDLKAFRVPANKMGRVHGGFNAALDHVWDDMHKYISANSKGKLIFYGGHSLGAGLVTIAASRLDGTVLYTFASPRIGNTKFALYMNMRIIHYRYVNAGDPVAAMPPPIFGWRHFGKQQLITSDILIRDATPTKGFGGFFKKKMWSKLLMLLSLGKWLVMDMTAEHNIISYNQWFREQVDLPPLEIPQEYLDQVGND